MKIWNLTEIKKSLKNVCLLHAEALLEEFGEFYPIAFGISSNSVIVPVLTYFGEEHPVSIDVIKNLELALKKSDEANEFEGVAICVDVLATPPYMAEKKDALEIRMDFKNSERINYYLPYNKGDKGNIFFLDEYQSEGTLNFFS